MQGVLPDYPIEEVDHKNQDSLDNKWSNLRIVNRQTNMKNIKRSISNTSGISGVGKRKDKSWQAHIRHEGKRKHLYQGHDFLEACCRRKSAERALGYHMNHGS